MAQGTKVYSEKFERLPDPDPLYHIDSETASPPDWQHLFDRYGGKGERCVFLGPVKLEGGQTYLVGFMRSPLWSTGKDCMMRSLLPLVFEIGADGEFKLVYTGVIQAARGVRLDSIDLVTHGFEPLSIVSDGVTTDGAFKFKWVSGKRTGDVIFQLSSPRKLSIVLEGEAPAAKASGPGENEGK